MSVREWWGLVGLKGKSWKDPAAITANILGFTPFFSLFLLGLPLKERGVSGAYRKPMRHKM